MYPHHISDGLEDNELPCYLGRAYRSMLHTLGGECSPPIERTIRIDPTEAVAPDNYAAHRRTDTAIIPALRIMDQWPITSMWHRADMRLDEPGRRAVDNAFSKAIRTAYNRPRIPSKHMKKRRRSR